MGFWSELFDSLLEDYNANSTPASRPQQPARESSDYRLGDVLSGKVAYVAEKFAKVESGDLSAVVFLGEISNSFVSDPADFLSAGQSVEFVLLKKDAKGWKASINAVPEAKARRALEKVSEGELVKGRVLELKDRGAILDAGEFQVWIPLAELSWGWIEDPADVVILGEEVEVKIIRIETPDGWLLDRRQRRAQAIASVRECIPEPGSPTISVAFSGIPFKVWAVAKTPRNFDAVSCFVLIEIVKSKSRDAITATTGLDMATLENIHAFLVAENLANNWLPSARGTALVEAIALASDLNNDPVRGIYASAAPSAVQLLSLDEHRNQQAFPRGWPRPPFNKPKEDMFIRATDEDLPEALLDKLVSDDKRERLANLLEDRRLRVFLRRDGESPWKPVFIDTSEHWLLAGLWSVFKPFIGSPFRPAKEAERCQNFLMIRCRAVLAGQGDLPFKTVFFEPNTETVWCLKNIQGVKINDARNKQFPGFPMWIERTIGPDTEPVSWELQPDSWCWIKVL
nr:S1 RNA-binding domain-containing protein [uncultured Halomonas sp.]